MQWWYKIVSESQNKSWAWARILSHSDSARQIWRSSTSLKSCSFPPAYRSRNWNREVDFMPHFPLRWFCRTTTQIPVLLHMGQGEELTKPNVTAAERKIAWLNMCLSPSHLTAKWSILPPFCCKIEGSLHYKERAKLLNLDKPDVQAWSCHLLGEWTHRTHGSSQCLFLRSQRDRNNFTMLSDRISKRLWEL